ncbi:FMN-linked oxidoreductase [Acaromyces ingoldii]|uniref:tRNA-dihydrouridine(47) synthase [NAD(P)(+)] n=1 Tax=Acaromyces ingoldii TaxID=215250 RepID=A0A316YN20_9BASI|nr:FMN-linked oxidoreductase [Acaromyces ingoldii]PWN89463.1 FMN-linked oxidoreductase [Acaromyces ingoldii]
MVERVKGVAPIRPEFVLAKEKVEPAADDDAAESKSNPAAWGVKRENEAREGGDAKKLKGDNNARRGGKRDDRKERGQNKGRKFGRIQDSINLCKAVARGGEGKCDRPAGTCTFSHSLQAYLDEKPEDLYFAPPPSDGPHGSLREVAEDPKREAYLEENYSTAEPFVKWPRGETICPVHLSAKQASSSSSGSCPRGWTCRYVAAHSKRSEDGRLELIEGSSSSGQDQDERNAPGEVNWPASGLAKALRTKTYQLPRTKAVLSLLQRHKENLADGPIELENQGSRARIEDAAYTWSKDDGARIRPSEKRKLDWFHDELYLAPLTTTGNLPFRRLCASLGSDIHCGEMGLAESYLQANKNEWSLVRRWEGERCFGTQLCGNKPDILVPVAEVLAREFGSTLDFIDVNCGCPIDLVYNRGGGSALLDHAGKLGKILRGMAAVTGEVPITAKLRTGTASNNPTTHKLYPRLQVEWGVGAATLHGRSRQQRYKNEADWSYIKRCADSLRESVVRNNEEGEGEYMHPVPIYGNGDVYSWQDYVANKELAGVDGQMIARGALIKPWVFTEIKEHRDWDISSRERLDLIRQFAHYGLTHWGSDSQGVNQTRRFLCEYLSFTHRYVPTGLLEHLPSRLNDRPPPYKGRDDLETLLASGKSSDWISISEMFLGKAPDQWSFLPKHKSSSYADGDQEQQG